MQTQKKHDTVTVYAIIITLVCIMLLI